MLYMFEILYIITILSDLKSNRSSHWGNLRGTYCFKLGLYSIFLSIECNSKALLKGWSFTNLMIAMHTTTTTVSLCRPRFRPHQLCTTYTWPTNGIHPYFLEIANPLTSNLAPQPLPSLLQNTISSPSIQKYPANECLYTNDLQCMATVPVLTRKYSIQSVLWQHINTVRHFKLTKYSMMGSWISCKL